MQSFNRNRRSSEKCSAVLIEEKEKKVLYKNDDAYFCNLQKVICFLIRLNTVKDCILFFSCETTTNKNSSEKKVFFLCFQNVVLLRKKN